MENLFEKEHPVSTIEKIKFPRIKHLFDESGKTRDDLLATPEERKEFLKKFNEGFGVLTEKIDGLNIGVGFTLAGELRLRHRNALVDRSSNDPIYQNVYHWAEQRQKFLRDLLKTNAVLFIEWMEWEHAVPYNKLPDFAQVITLFDAEEGENGKYMSHRYIKELFQNSGIAVVPEVTIAKSIESANDCLSMISQSNFSTKSNMEGLILRIDNGDYNQAIVKFVHPDFTSAVDQSKHWAVKKLKKNKIDYEAQARLLNT